MRSICWTMLVLTLPALGCGQGAGSSDPVAQDSSATGDAASSAAAPVLSGRYPGLERAAEAPTPDPDAHLHPVVVLRTSAGEITVRLNAEAAPVTVGNFLQYVDEGHYRDVVFHQVVDGYMILGGGLTSSQSEKPTRPPIRNEAHNGLTNRRGTIAMARNTEAIDSATCQFFINLVDNPHLDHHGRSTEEYGYCVFGEVIAGMDVVDKIAKTPVRDATPIETVSIREALRR